MPFHVGERVVHPLHGVGVVTRLAELQHKDECRMYYVIAAHGRLTLSVPLDEAAKVGLRSVVSSNGLTALFGILSSPAKPLNEQPRERQLEIAERFREGTLEALCSIIRDLTVRGRTKRLNENDTKALRRSRDLLLEEWALVKDVLVQDASNELNALLAESTTQLD